jgi:hypothetical protein
VTLERGTAAGWAPTAGALETADSPPHCSDSVPIADAIAEVVAGLMVREARARVRLLVLTGRHVERHLIAAYDRLVDREEVAS